MTHTHTHNMLKVSILRALGPRRADVLKWAIDTQGKQLLGLSEYFAICAAGKKACFSTVLGTGCGCSCCFVYTVRVGERHSSSSSSYAICFSG